MKAQFHQFWSQMNEELDDQDRAVLGPPHAKSSFDWQLHSRKPEINFEGKDNFGNQRIIIGVPERVVEFAQA